MMNERLDQCESRSPLWSHAAVGKKVSTPRLACGVRRCVPEACGAGAAMMHEHSNSAAATALAWVPFPLAGCFTFSIKPLRRHWQSEDGRA